MLEQGAGAFVLVVQSVSPKVAAEDMRFGESRARMEAFQHQLVFFDGCCDQKTVVEDAQDEGVEAMRHEGEREESSGGEGRQDVHENLPIRDSISTARIRRNLQEEYQLTSLGRE